MNWGISYCETKSEHQLGLQVPLGMQETYLNIRNIQEGPDADRLLEILRTYTWIFVNYATSFEWMTCSYQFYLTILQVCAIEVMREMCVGIL